jgi:hypothetical protein
MNPLEMGGTDSSAGGCPSAGEISSEGWSAVPVSLPGALHAMAATTRRVIIISK